MPVTDVVLNVQCRAGLFDRVASCGIEVYEIDFASAPKGHLRLVALASSGDVCFFLDASSSKGNHSAATARLRSALAR